MCIAHGVCVFLAARMESNGERNRIHVSMETAELLRMGAKQHWLKQREDKIVVSVTCSGCLAPSSLLNMLTTLPAGSYSNFPG